MASRFDAAERYSGSSWNTGVEVHLHTLGADSPLREVGLGEVGPVDFIEPKAVEPTTDLLPTEHRSDSAIRQNGCDVGDRPTAL